MIIDDEDIESLTAYLTVLLKPIANCESNVLAEYVIALLKHDKGNLDDLKTFCAESLTDFLNTDDIGSFLNTLFKSLESKEYLSFNASPAVIEEDEDDDDEDGDSRRNRRKERENVTSTTTSDSYESRKRERSVEQRSSFNYPNKRSTNGPRSGSYNTGRSSYNNNNSSSYRTQRGRCFDYDEKGYCLRGDACPYDHGNDRIVVNDPSMAGVTSMGPMGPMILAMGGGWNGTPTAQQLELQQRQLLQLQQQMPNMPMPNMNMFPSPINTMPPMPNPMMPNFRPRSSSSRGASFTGRGGARPSIGGGVSTYQPSLNQLPVLTIDKIPKQFCNREEISKYFAKFGNIMNIQVDEALDQAIVHFSDMAEARAAYSCPEVIFGNRFVKVYWHQYKIQNAAGKSTTASPTTTTSPTSTPTKEQHLLSLSKQKEALIQKQIQQQKELMNMLEKNSAKLTTAEKQEIMTKIKDLSEVTNKTLSGAKGELNVKLPKQEEEVDPELVKKLEALKKTAAEMGIDPKQLKKPILRGGYRGSRGAGIPRKSLDNRPKKFSFAVPENIENEVLEKHFRTFGHVEQFSVESNVVAYRNRWEAEAAFGKGGKIWTGDGKQLDLELKWIQNEVSSVTVAAAVDESTNGAAEGMAE